MTQLRSPRGEVARIAGREAARLLAFVLAGSWRRPPRRRPGRRSATRCDFPAPQTNYVEVEAVVPTDGRPRIEMMMAVWTPGSYLVREYERNLEAVQAKAGRARPCRSKKR